MKEKSLNYLLLQYMVPSTTGLLVIALYVIVDSIFVGRGVGKEALAALNIAYPIITISSAISLMIGMGASTLISLYHGKKHLEELCLSYIHCLNFLFYLVLVFLVFFCSKQVLWILGGETSLEAMIRGYLYPCTVGMIFLMISTGWNAAVRNLGAPKYAFFSMLAGALCNVFFDWIFIFPLHLGIQGAAIASSMGQILSFFLLFFFFRKKRIFIPFLPRKISWSLLQRLFSIGFSSFIMEFAAAIVLVLFNIQFMKYGGEISVSAFCIVASTFYFFRMLFTGLGQGLQPIVSFFFGKKEREKGKEVYRKAKSLALGISVLCFAFVFFQKESIMSFYHSDRNFILFAARGLLLYCTSIFFVAFNLLSISYYQAVGNGRLANIFSFGRSFLFLLPFLYLLPAVWGVTGMWLVLTFTEASTSISIFCYQNYRKKKKFLDIGRRV